MTRIAPRGRDRSGDLLHRRMRARGAEVDHRVCKGADHTDVQIEALPEMVDRWRSDWPSDLLRWPGQAGPSGDGEGPDSAER
ncbi:hypothetical protein ABT218_24290 [Streptomyces sp. NPDC001455]|uniref:hypothetical protein n=1 Tax=unclassified Streptomyces TaxID=2593676 RepID=UPI003319E1E6